MPTAPPARDLAAGLRIDPEQRYLLHNRTPKRIRVVADQFGEVTLAPLAQRVVNGARIAPFEGDLQLLRQRHQLRVRRYTSASPSNRLLQFFLWLVLIVLLVVVLTWILREGTLLRREVGAAGGLFLLTVAAVLLYAGLRERERRHDEDDADIEEGDIEFGVGGAFYDGNETARRTKLIFTLLVVVAVGAILPAIAIFVATDATDFLVMEGGLQVKDGAESRLVSRVIQVVYTAVLALFPALLYFQFDRQRVGTIRGKWVRAIFRMDKQMTTLADVNARYGDELAEASSYSTVSVRFLGGRNSPIVVATILISLGWTLLVARTESFDFAGATRISGLAESADDAAARAEDAIDGSGDLAARTAAADAAAGEAARASAEAAEIAAESFDDTVPPTAPTDPPAAERSQDALEDDAAAAAVSAQQAAAAESTVRQPFFQLLVPTPSAATMAFLGAYFFAVYLILRGYFRGDLRPKIYNQITARLVTVVVLAYLLTVVFNETGERNPFLWTVAFIAGIVPTTILQRLGIVASSMFGSPTEDQSWLRNAFAEAFSKPRSLTQIDGIDIYESSRLESEGISDIPTLAKSDLVSTMISTHLPIERLVDWTDQAVLIVLLDDGREDEEAATRVRDLRKLGIRTASSLRNVARAEGQGQMRAAVEAILVGGPVVDGAAHLQWLAMQIDNEPSFQRIQQWYRSERVHATHDCPVIDRNGPTPAAGPSANGDEPAPVPVTP